jgi:hypothetical protein
MYEINPKQMMADLWINVHLSLININKIIKIFINIKSG